MLCRAKYNTYYKLTLKASKQALLANSELQRSLLFILPAMYN